MKYLIFIFIILSKYNYALKMWIQDSTATITESKIKTINQETYSNILLTGT